MTQSIGILTAGGDSPGLNAAIRAIGKSAIHQYGWNVIGFRDGFRGLMQNRIVRLDKDTLSGILTSGGTILGCGRDKPHRMRVGDKVMDMTDAMLDSFNHHGLDALVCIGGGGTHKNALRLSEKGMPIVTLPKTIDNDLYGTDDSLGFDTALGIATEAVDRLHSTAHSHHRIIVVEIMGHNAGWLTLGAGLSGGADVIVIPEIPYSVDAIADAISMRRSAGSTFSVVAVAEGAISKRLTEMIAAVPESPARDEAVKQLLDERKTTVEIARELEDLTGLESRVTILGHVQRGGAPSPMDRVVATKLGVAATATIASGTTGVMVASRGEDVALVPLTEVAGKVHLVPQDHPWIRTARALGVCMGDSP
ncbi:MAG: ATP-dependent 6-phosphofructokinase [Acidimicrobiia bacterium]